MTSEWAAWYRAAIAGDPGRRASNGEVARYRGAVWYPDPPTPTAEKLTRFGSPPLEGPQLYVESLDELRSGGDAFVPVVANLAYRGLKSLVVGQSKAGKSFLLWAMSAGAARAGLRVLYLSEEPRGTVLDKVQKFGLREQYGKSLYVSRRQHARMRLMEWPDVCAATAEFVRLMRIDLVVFDTARPWMRLQGDESNSADAVGPYLDALGPVCEAGAAVVVLHQSPWDKKRARNSTEWHAATDLIFHVEGQGTGARTVSYLGGRVEDIPSSWVFRWSPEGGGENLGRMRRDAAQRADAILQVLEDADGPLTAEQVADEAEIHPKAVRRVLTRLEESGSVVQEGGGVIPGRGQEPARWRRPGQFSGLLETVPSQT